MSLPVFDMDIATNHVAVAILTVSLFLHTARTKFHFNFLMIYFIEHLVLILTSLVLIYCTKHY